MDTVFCIGDVLATTVVLCVASGVVGCVEVLVVSVSRDVWVCVVVLSGVASVAVEVGGAVDTSVIAGVP